MINKKIQGKKNKASGARFELKVRKDLESKGWIVDKWSNNVEFEQIEYPVDSNCGFTEGKLIPAKRKYNPFKGVFVIGTGFPDFIAFKILEREGIYCMVETNQKNTREFLYEVIGVESKSNGYLDKEEKGKMDWLLQNHVFSKILVAMKDKNKRGGIIYKEYEKN